MSSDPFADLARGTSKLAEALYGLLNENRGLPAAGSRARQEAGREAYAGGWGAHPARDVTATMMLASWSCIDHLRGLAAVLETRGSIAALYTLARGVAEAAVVPCYLSEVGIGPLERVRRNMNCNLESICQDLNMLRRFGSAEAQQRISRHEDQLEAIERTGQRYWFTFKPQDGFRSAYLGEKPPAAMSLIDQCATQTKGVGALSYQMLSGVAHARLHGLSRFLMTGSRARPGQPGKVMAEMNVRAPELAQQLFVGPLCVFTLVEHLHWFLGWDTTDVVRAVTFAENIWCRIAGIPYAGPRLR